MAYTTKNKNRENKTMKFNNRSYDNVYRKNSHQKKTAELLNTQKPNFFFFFNTIRKTLNDS